jgi:hypothetical protein
VPVERSVTTGTPVEPGVAKFTKTSDYMAAFIQTSKTHEREHTKKRTNRHTHHESVDGGCSPGIRKRIQSNVNLVVALVMIAEFVDFRQQMHPFL